MIHYKGEYSYLTMNHQPINRIRAPTLINHTYYRYPLAIKIRNLSSVRVKAEYKAKSQGQLIIHSPVLAGTTVFYNYLSHFWLDKD